MVDTMIIQARLMSHDTFIEKPTRRTQAVHESATKSACAWYSSKQAGVHTRIKALLGRDGFPLSNSIALFQLDVIEIIHFGIFSKTDVLEETADAIVGLGRDVVRGAASAALSTVTVGTGLLFGFGHEVRRGLFR